MKALVEAFSVSCGSSFEALLPSCSSPPSRSPRPCTHILKLHSAAEFCTHLHSWQTSPQLSKHCTACCLLLISSFFLFLLRCRYASRQKLFCEQFTPTAFLKFPGQTFLAFYYNKASDVCAGAGHRRNVLSVFCNIEKTIMITSSLNYGPAGFVIRVAGILFPRRCRFNNKQFPWGKFWVEFMWKWIKVSSDN